MALVHPNYIKSSNLLVISGVIGLLGLVTEGISLSEKIVSALLILMFVRVMSYFIRRGNKSVKYGLLVLVGLGTLLMIPALFIAQVSIVTVLISALQTGLQI